MSTPEDYRRYAERCLDVARRAASPHEADAFSAMARAWTKLANDEERIADLIRDADAGFAPGDDDAEHRRPTAFWEADLRF